MIVHIKDNVIADACHFLEDMARSKRGAGLLSAQALAPLRRLQQESSYIDATLPRVLLLGEFKAGKSTLLNALLGGRQAASDLFEMTSWIARYWPADTPFCRLHLHGGGEVEMSPVEFLNRSETRSFSTEELARIDRVDVGVAQAPLRVAFIDTPGLGSVTRANERRLIDALDEADIVLWVVAADALGGQREALLVRDLVSKGIPYAVALTKSDLLECLEEREEILHFLTQTYGVEAAAVYPVEALTALQIIEGGGAPGSDTGIMALRAHLDLLEVRGASIRSQAQAAHQRRCAELAIALLSRVEEPLEEAVHSISDFTAIAEQVRQAVQAQSEHEVEQIVRSRLLGGARDAISAELGATLHASKGALSGDVITAVFARHLGSDHLTHFWSHVQAELLGGLPRWWSHHLQDARGDVQAALAQLDDGAWTRVVETLEPKALAVSVEAKAAGALEAGVRTSLGLAGVATAYVAWLGPMAAQVTLGAAVTGVGIPLALMGAGVSAMLYMFQKNREAGAASVRTEMLLDSYVQNFIDGVVRPHVHSRLAEINEGVARSLVDTFRERLEDPLPGRAEDLLRVARNLQVALRARM